MTITRNTPTDPETEALLTPPVVAPAEEILSSDEKFDHALAEIKQYVRAHSWDAAAMFFGTAVYMGVYYTDAYFKVFGSTGRYIVHNLAMGVAANAIAVPFVRQGRLVEGETSAEANRDSFRYFLLCVVPDSLYQPVEDWFIAMCQSGSPIDFEFIQDATAVFSPAEIVASFAMFGVAFGLLYLVMKKLLIKHDEPTPVEGNAFDDEWQKFYKKSEDTLRTPVGESIKSAVQYFIFYLSDYIFDLELNGPATTLLNLFGCCTWMAGYSFIFDSLPEVFAYLQIRRERELTLAHESLTQDYVQVNLASGQVESDEDIFEIVEKMIKVTPNVSLEDEELISEEEISEAKTDEADGLLPVTSRIAKGSSAMAAKFGGIYNNVVRAVASTHTPPENVVYPLISSPSK